MDAPHFEQPTIISPDEIVFIPSMKIVLDCLTAKQKFVYLTAPARGVSVNINREIGDNLMQAWNSSVQALSQFD